jgi:hypothetical protein
MRKILILRAVLFVSPLKKVVPLHRKPHGVRPQSKNEDQEMKGGLMKRSSWQIKYNAWNYSKNKYASRVLLHSVFSSCQR